MPSPSSHPWFEDRELSAAAVLRSSARRCRAVVADTRAQSELFGVVLLIGIVVLATAALVVYGNAAVADNEERIEFGRAANGLAQFDERASRVAFGESDRQHVDVGVSGADGSLDTRPNDGWLRMTVVNASSGAAESVVVNQTLGALVYHDGATSVAYQGGGVWRGDRSGSTMLSRPEFHVRATTLTLPVIVTGGDGAVYSEVTIRPDGPAVEKFPDPTRNLTNKVTGVKLQITVQSDYYLAWARYFAEHTDGAVTVDHAARTATVTYLSLPSWFGLDSGIIATSGSGEIRLGGNSIYIDSYDSSLGSYSETQRANGTITAVNDVVSTGSSNVQGDVRSGADVDLSGTTDISGTVYWTDSYEPDGASVNGGDQQIDGVANIEPIDGYVRDTVAATRSANDNANTSLIADGTLTGSGTLNAGTYYLRNLTLGPGDSLTFDTTGGDVVVAVEDAVAIEGKGTSDSKAATIDVVGGGNVTVFVLGGSGNDLTVGKNAQVDVPVQRSGQFRVYGTSSLDGVIRSDNSPSQLRFEGVVYAPAGVAGTGSIEIGQAKFYGAIVTGNLDVDQNAEIHYDQGLAHERFPRSPTVTRIEYLHVTVHGIRVTSG